MSILHQIDELRASLQGTEVVAYIDLSAEMVLGWSSAMVQPQEWLDALCATAGDILGGAEGRLTEAMKLSSTGAMILLRSPTDTSEALCIVCAPDIDVDAARRQARAILENAPE